MILNFLQFLKESISYDKENRTVIYNPEEKIKSEYEIKNRMKQISKSSMKKYNVKEKPKKETSTKKQQKDSYKRGIKVDTNIFKDDIRKEINTKISLYKKYKNIISEIFDYKIVYLKKTGVKVINLYKLDQEISKILKTNKFIRVEQDNKKDKIMDHTVKNFINKGDFLRKNYFYFVDIIKRNIPDVDILITPKSSSNFNSKNIFSIAQKLDSKTLYVDDSFFVKDVSKISIDEDWLKIADDIYKYDEKELNDLKRRIKKWIEIDEPKRSKIREENDLIHKLESAITLRMKTGENRGGDTIEMKELKKKLSEIQKDIKQLSHKGKDSTRDKDRISVKEWQIKNLSEKERLAIKGFMDINMVDGDKKLNNNIFSRNSIINKLENKKIVIFDDNLASGATLDESCKKLIDMGAKAENILCITLGIMESYNTRGNRNNDK